MDARTQRTALRVASLLGALVVGTGIIILFPNLDPRLSGPILGLTITAALGLDQFLKNTGDNAPPSVAGVNSALLGVAAGNPLASVPPPKVTVPDPPVVTTLPPTG